MTGDTDDDVEITSGTCTLRGTKIGRNIKIKNGASLKAESVTVGGDVQGEGHGDVVIKDGSVGGNVQLKGGGTANVSGVKIGGDLQSENNRGAQTFTANTIDGNLQCKSNSPAPSGSGNQAQGNKEDQCA